MSTKKTILFSVLHRFDRSPSQRYRYEQYIDFFEQNGFECHFSPLLNEQDDKVFYAPGNLFGKFLILLKSLAKRTVELLTNNYDIVFVQRENFMLGTSFFERIMAKRSKLVFDFDDSIWMLNMSEGNKNLAFLKRPEKTAEIIKASHLVIAGNEYLAAYARQFNSNVHVIPTTVDTDIYKPSIDIQAETVCIGWNGSPTTIPHFETVEKALLKLKEKYGDKIRFKVVGDGKYINEKLGIKGCPWKKETEVSAMDDMDIGIMPLPDDLWSQGKCGLKGLLYMSMAIPNVMSPVGVNAKIIQDGKNGFLAATEQEWIEKLSLLVESKALRERLGKAGRQTVLEEYSVIANRDKYIRLLNSL